ncbi:kinesin-like protein KIF21A [Uloborus diversus]|uniref:kinesin-like protein KIF21A n=1 Tax=Uloborus diversus TaxID=327109 RepID=UPI00240A951C|nr:kinesin-like protein KIF21A [Uloborus diversus]
MSEEEYESDEKMNSEHEECETDSDEEVKEKITLKARKIRKSDGKWKVYYESKVFKREWIDIFPWVEEDPEDPKLAICRACNKKIKAHKSILETHQKTKRHIRNISGSDDVDDEQPKKEEKPEQPKNLHVPMEQMISEDQIAFFAESSIDAAHQAVTSLIDKLVEKYHENRLENLREQNEAQLGLNNQKAQLLRAENQRKLEMRMQQEAYSKEAQDFRLKLMQLQHETKIGAMEEERDAKLRAVEQELMFARQEYEKKMKLLDVQLSCIK